MWLKEKTCEQLPTRRDAREISGLKSSEWGWALPAEKGGYIEHKFSAEKGCEFESANIRIWLAIRRPLSGRLIGKMANHNKTTISANGKNSYHTLFEDEECEFKRYDLTKYVRGKSSFRVHLDGKNIAQQSSLLLHGFTLDGKVVKK